GLRSAEKLLDEVDRRLEVAVAIAGVELLGQGAGLFQASGGRLRDVDLARLAVEAAGELDVRHARARQDAQPQRTSAERAEAVVRVGALQPARQRDRPQAARFLRP